MMATGIRPTSIKPAMPAAASDTRPTTAATAASTLLVCDAARTAQLLDFAGLMDAVATAATDYAAGRILSPERLMVPLGQGGVLLSMPATAPDIAIHKLVNVQPANARQGLPTIHGVVTACDTATGRPLCLLDGPEVTGRRTAAVTMLGIRHGLSHAPGPSFSRAWAAPRGIWQRGARRCRRFRRWVSRPAENLLTEPSRRHGGADPGAALGSRRAAAGAGASNSRTSRIPTSV